MRVLTTYCLVIILADLTMGSTDDICEHTPAADGFGLTSCADYTNMFSYYPDKKECLEFSYGGCGGNENRFETKALCEAECKK
ncbi:chymotrypsin inhibitor SCI-II [Drosophila elegans]|uniref:chymotrypsin inhibitor SCI-II n=1 Tax=Drosophila elegans TaxID=30023 RepID=UPI0007E7AA0F|nr:chymotrypsin inhibitor SCI-II [Drosophila elegans]